MLPQKAGSAMAEVREHQPTALIRPLPRAEELALMNEAGIAAAAAAGGARLGQGQGQPQGQGPPQS